MLALALLVLFLASGHCTLSTRIPAPHLVQPLGAATPARPAVALPAAEQPRDAPAAAPAAAPADAPADAPAAARKPRSTLPGWGVALNHASGMPLITHADSWHAHAASGAAWLASAYPILFFSWYAAYADPSAFGLAPGLSLPLCLCLIAGVTTSATGYPMRPKKHFPHYTGQMRNSMLCTSLSALLVATFAAEPHLPPPLVAAAHAATALGAGLVAYDAVVARTPWDISQVVIDLKLELPPRAAILAANTISLSWLAIFAAAVSHVLLGGASAHDLLGSAGPEGSAAFAAQMALALALAPASEALVGTSMQKDRFTKKDGAHVLVHQLDSGGFRPAHWLEACELLFNVPGPATITIGLALLGGHAELVRHFFFFDALTDAVVGGGFGFEFGAG